MTNMTTSEFSRVRTGYERALALYEAGRFKPAITALKRPIRTLEYGGEKTLFLAKCYRLLAACHQALDAAGLAAHYEREAGKIEIQIKSDPEDR